MDEGAVARLARRFAVRYEPALASEPAKLRDAVGEADALIVRNATRVDAELVGSAPRLAVVGRLGVGLDNIDVDACAARKIEVIPAIGANARAVAEYVLAAALILLRGAFASTAAVAAGRWPRSELAGGGEIGGRTIGLVGFGSIGRLTGRLARSLGMRAIGFDPQVPPASPIWVEDETLPRGLDPLLREADVVSLHVPLAPATRNLIDAARIATMKRDAMLINTARGGVVDEAALAAALRAGKLGGAALDVFDREPLPAGSPLAGCPNLVLTPHVAGLTRESNVRVSALIASKVAEALAPAR